MQALPAISPTHGFWNLPVDAARHGHAFDAHLLLNLWIALGLLALAHLILLLGLAIRKRSHRPTSQLHIEYLPLAALTLLFALLAIRSESLWAAQRYTGADLSAMQVEVTGMQFVWYFRTHPTEERPIVYREPCHYSDSGDEFLTQWSAASTFAPKAE